MKDGLLIASDGQITSGSEIFSSIEKTGIDTEGNLLDIPDKIHELSLKPVDETHR